MATFTLCILLALATMTLAGPNHQTASKGVKILSVIQGKEVIKAFLRMHPEIDYQVVGSRGTPDFPNSKTGMPGQLRLVAAMNGRDPIGRYIAETGIPYTVPDGMQPSEMPFGHPSYSRTPQDLVNSGLGKLPQPSPFVGDPPPPPQPLSHEEELAAWNSGLGKVPNFEPAAGPADATSYARDPSRQPTKNTFEEQLDAWNNGRSNSVPDVLNPVLRAAAKISYIRSLGGPSIETSLTDPKASHEPDAKLKSEDSMNFPSSPSTPGDYDALAEHPELLKIVPIL